MPSFVSQANQTVLHFSVATQVNAATALGLALRDVQVPVPLITTQDMDRLLQVQKCTVLPLFRQGRRGWVLPLSRLGTGAQGTEKCSPMTCRLCCPGHTTPSFPY